MDPDPDPDCESGYGSRDPIESGSRSTALPQPLHKFLCLGKPESPDVFKRLTAESEDFKDILLEDFRDTYLNLTLKVCLYTKD
jgi:hypothetical protein